MAVNEIKQTQEEQAEEAKKLSEKTDSLKSDILKTLDVEQNIKDLQLGDEPKETDENPLEDEDGIEAEDVEEEEESDEDEDSEDEEGDEEEAEEADDEEVVPKSKLKKIQEKTEKRISRYARKVKQLEAELEETKVDAGKDPDLVKLEKMPVSELKTLKRDVRRAQIKAQGDDARLDQLLDLEEKIDNTITTAPNRFTNTQVELYNLKAAEIHDELEDQGVELTDKDLEFIKQKAANIYHSKKIFKEAKTGQATALELAVEHWKEVKSAAPAENKSDPELKRKLNRLKRKTSLSTKSSKSRQINDRLKRLQKKAFRGGDDFDRTNLVKSDPRFGIDDLIPEELKG